MPAIARGQPSDCSNPVLDLFTQVNGILFQGVGRLDNIRMLP